MQISITHVLLSLYTCRVHDTTYSKHRHMFKYNLMHNIKIQINKDYTKTTNEIQTTPFYAIM